MAEQELGALLVTDPANLYYLTGYNAWSFYTPQFLFVPADGDLYFFTRAMDAVGASRTAILPREQIIGYPETLVHQATAHPFGWAANALRDIGVVKELGRTRVGLEMDAHFFSPKAYLSLGMSLPEWQFVDSLELVNWIRLVKSSAEIDAMRAAADIASSAMRAAVDTIQVGVRQCDAAAEITRAQIIGTPSHGGDYPAIVPMMPTGVAADTPHLTWSDDRFERNEAVIVELAGVHRRYHVPLARTIMLGNPSAPVARVAEAARTGIEAVLDMVRPGVRAADLADTWDTVLARHGLEKPSRIGYSIGIGYPPDWGERTVSLRGDDATVLQENMTFHLICGMWMDGYGYEVSESILVTADGVETFTRFPRDLLRSEK